MQVKTEDDYQAESDLRTLAQAEAIRKDSKRLKAALSKAKEKIADLQAVQSESKSKS